MTESFWSWEERFCESSYWGLFSFFPFFGLRTLDFGLLSLEKGAEQRKFVSPNEIVDPSSRRIVTLMLRVFQSMDGMMVFQTCLELINKYHQKTTATDHVSILRYLLLIPLNVFGLALPTTTFLTLFPPSVLALEALDSPQTEGMDDNVKSLLSYFVALGFVQFLESLAAGVLEKRIR